MVGFLFYVVFTAFILFLIHSTLTLNERMDWQDGDFSDDLDENGNVIEWKTESQL